jgi:phage shock protein A
MHLEGASPRRRKMFISRMLSLIGGKLRRWLRAREARDPEAVYEAAISDRLRRYHQLKSAAAGVIYMRNKLERELRTKSVELKEVEEQAGQAADMNEDQCALILIQRKHELEADCSRLREELGELTREAEDAKKNLIGFKGEIEKLKIEKVRMLARLRNAQARVRIQEALESLSYDEDVRALEEVRESIQRTLAQAGVNREMGDSELGAKLDEIRRSNAETKAAAELAELKRRRRPPLAPMDIFTHAADAVNGGPHTGNGEAA